MWVVRKISTSASKAAEGSRTPGRFANFVSRACRRKVLECGCPLPLWAWDLATPFSIRPLISAPVPTTAGRGSNPPAVFSHTLLAEAARFPSHPPSRRLRLSIQAATLRDWRGCRRRTLRAALVRDSGGGESRQRQRQRKSGKAHLPI